MLDSRRGSLREWVLMGGPGDHYHYYTLSLFFFRGGVCVFFKESGVPFPREGYGNDFSRGN